MSTDAQTLVDIRRVRHVARSIGIAGMVVTAAGILVSREQFFQSYLWAFLFWLGMALGFMPLLMLYHLVGGAWGFGIRRIAESGIRTLPLMALLFLPIVFGIQDLYRWSHPEVIAESELLRAKEGYLNVPFWIVRAAFYFGVWLFYAWRLSRLSLEQDRTGDIALERRFERLSGPGLIVYGLTLSFAMFDWAMSLEPEWYSSIYGMLWIVSQALTALAFSVAVLAFLSRRPPAVRAASPEKFHDYGNLLLAFVMLWAYLSFAQLLIIWSGNLPEEIGWYIARLQHGWGWVAAALLAFHFAAPFVLLLSRVRKRGVKTLARIAILILAMRVVDVFWIVTPAFHSGGIAFHWMDFFALAGIGGIWLTVYAGKLAAFPLLPLHDPNTAPHRVL